jgi:hypothetical protein
MSAQETSINGLESEPVWLVCKLSCNNESDVLDSTMPYIEQATDQLSFFSQCPVLIKSTVVECIEGEAHLSQYPAPIQPPKFKTSIYEKGVSPTKIRLWKIPSNFNERDRAALRWYHKALAAPYEIDKFIFLWVCLEICCKISGESIRAKYVNNACNHTIEACPECGKLTEKEVNGKTMLHYLVEKLNVDDKMAKRMWKFRQLVHGNNALTTKVNKEMEVLVINLQSALCLSIKRRLGFADASFPKVRTDGFIADNTFGFGMKVT